MSAPRGSFYFVLSENEKARSESQLIVICKRHGEGFYLKKERLQKKKIRKIVWVGDGNSRTLCETRDPVDPILDMASCHMSRGKRVDHM